MTTTGDLYLAFASGALTYDCPPCGKCCRGYGMGSDLVHIGTLPEVRQIATFLDEENTRGPLVTFFTYADGCRYLGDDNLCDIHRERGSAAKPRICRLFPFSKLADIDGLWTVLPHHRCPWTARPDAAATELSDHATILKDFTNAEETFLDGLTPTPCAAATPMQPAARRQLEESIRDALSLDALDGTAAAAIETMIRIQTEHTAGATPVCVPMDRELWLDMLRCAGPPEPLSPHNERLFIAAIPAMRAELIPDFPQQLIPVALAAFALWLRSLAELQQRDFNGQDLLSLLARLVPMLRLLATAELPIPPLPDLPDLRDAPAAGASGNLPRELEEVWEELRENRGEPFGKVLLAALRPHERGALSMMHKLGTLWSV